MILIINCNLTLIKNGLMIVYRALQSNNEPASGGGGRGETMLIFCAALEGSGACILSKFLIFASLKGNFLYFEGNILYFQSWHRRRFLHSCGIRS